MADAWATHVVELHADHVVKRYRHWDEQEHEREWRSLTLLQTYSPGLSPAPLNRETTREIPALIMTCLPGTVLRGGLVTPSQVSALAAALTELHHCVRREVAAALPLRTWHQRQCIDYINRRHPELATRALEPAITQAAADGMAWLNITMPRVRRVCRCDPTPRSR